MFQIIKYATEYCYWFAIWYEVQKEISSFDIVGDKKQPLGEHSIKTKILFQRTLSQEDKHLCFGFFLLYSIYKTYQSWNSSSQFQLIL